MTQVVNRIYATSERAAAAVTALVEAGLEQEHIRTVSLADAESGSLADITVAIQRAGVRNPAASELAKPVGDGGTLVSCRAPFTTAFGANAVLDRCGPIAAPRRNMPTHKVKWDDERPLSAIFGWKLLSETALPFAKFWGAQSLVRSGPWLSPWAQFPLLAQAQGPVMGTKQLSSNATPFSSTFSIPLLLKR
jgi:hypothetical protein